MCLPESQEGLPPPPSPPLLPAPELGAAGGAQAEKRERLELAAIETDAGKQAALALAASADQASAARHARSWDQAASASKRRKKAPVESKVLGGAEYRSRKPGAAGDVKKAGRPDPFAYVPFDKRALNKRASRKPRGALAGVFQAGKAARGAKARK